MLVSAFAFELPEELIAQTPPAVRGTSRMLVMDRATGTLADDVFLRLPERLRAGDLLVLNDSRVLPGRLMARRAGLRTQAGSPEPSGAVEVLLTAAVEETAAGENVWDALVRPAKKVSVGETLLFADPQAPEEVLLLAEVVAAGEFGERRLRFAPVEDFFAVLERIGSLPLPPYIRRERGERNTVADRERYQTVYAQAAGGDGQRSAAAPTAGLHFTPEVLRLLEERGVEIVRVTLHVGLGTFQPVRVAELKDIRLHAERYTLPEATAAAVNRARAAGRRVVAAGTTVTRTLEHCATEAERTGAGALVGHSGETCVFLSPGYRFRVVDGLLTNFHLPESTLLMLVSAFAGRVEVLAAYAHAVRERYRFFSYGDCMLLV